ncbi:MAG: hypothetical protein FWG34_02770 [Oscillospiraceae bacterium]|nr:hypothetical protein [Oscillospiraceae bacterium]
MNPKDRHIIRELAARYCELAKGDKNSEKVLLYKGANDLKMIRPVVLIDEIPWGQLNIDGELSCKCEDSGLHRIESHFRMGIFREKYFPTDNYLLPYWPVHKHGGFGGMHGIERDVKTHHEEGWNIMAQEYHDVLPDEEALAKLNWAPGGYDKEATMKQYEFMGDLLGDILPVKIVGHDTGMGLTLWDQVALFRGVTPLLTDLAERPEFMHKIARKITDGYIKSIAEAVKYNLLAVDFPTLHCSPAFTDDLEPVEDFDHIEPKNTWGRGVAQIFGDVSPEMHDEFDTKYQIEATKDFGLVYYGCCERLDNKIHLLKKMKNLRKISITPWSDVNVAAELIGKDYEMSVKMNPANVGASFGEAAIRNEYREIANAAKKNGCAFDIVLKDISTIEKNPQNLITWAKILMEEVCSY